MKFNYADGYINHPEHFQKISLFDRFLEKLSDDNKDEFSKDLYTSLSFMAFGVGKADIIYNPNPEMPEDIEKQIKKELIRLYPPKMNYKEARQAMSEYWELTTPRIVSTDPVHMIEGCIFAPRGSDRKTLETIYNRIKDEQTANEEILLDMGLGNTDMRLFLIIKMKGYYWPVPLELYSAENPLGNAGG